MKRVRAVCGGGPVLLEPVAPERVREGAPVTETKLDFEHDARVFAGEWSASAGAWTVTYEEWEFCHLIEGVCELVSADGTVARYEAGDSFIIEPGFTGLWRVIEPMKKRFAVWYQ